MTEQPVTPIDPGPLVIGTAGSIRKDDVYATIIAATAVGLDPGYAAWLVRASNEYQKMRKALEEIADSRNKTLLGGDDDQLIRAAPGHDPSTFLAYEVGANAAFNDCADIADTVLTLAQEPPPREMPYSGSMEDKGEGGA